MQQARPYWFHIASLFLLSLLSTPITLLSPLPLKIAVDNVIGDQAVPGFLERLLPAAATRSDTAILVLAGILVVVLALLWEIHSVGRSFLSSYTGEKLVLGFRARLFRHAQRLSLSYHDSTGTSDSIYRIRHDASSIKSIAVDSVIPFLVDSFTLASMLYIILRLSGKLGLIALAVVPVLFIFSGAYRYRIRGQSRQVKRLESSALAAVQESFGAMRVVRAFGQEEREQDRFVHRFGEGARARIRLTLTQRGFRGLLGMTLAIGTAVVLFVGVREVQSGALTLGELIIVMTYLSILYSPLRNITKQVGTIQTSLASAERAFALLDQEPDVVERPNARSLRRSLGAVTFRNVSFAYGDEDPVLQDISLEIRPGTRLGIAGATGAGKSTLVNLLNRFYDPTAGQILLDDVDLRDYKLADLRDQFAVVLQETVLLSATIAENISYGRPNSNDEEIEEAARLANAHEFIMSLPDGYETQVGERGMRLSGGERQRIGLARAFLKDAPILILDEPTSSVDIQTEAEILEAMSRIVKDRTTFMIAHRLGLLENCDVLLKLERGQIASAMSNPPNVAGSMRASD